MVRSLILLMVFSAFGCAKEKQSDQDQPDSLKTNLAIVKEINSTSEHTTDGAELEDKIDVDSALIVATNDYLLTLEDGTLSLCCYDLLDITASLPLEDFQMMTEEYKEEGNVKIVEVYSLGESFYKTFYNKHPDVQKTDLVYGEIRTEKVVFSHGIRIGMGKSELLEKLFKPSKLFDRVSKLEVAENEMGDAWTVYIFESDKLVRIEFDSNYDWIEKSFKK